MSTESNPDDTTDESSGSRLTRREALAVLGSGGAALALSGASAQSGEGTFNIGGGDMADQLSHIQANVYRGPESELPDPGVENRIYKITEADGSTYSSGDILEDTGDAWQVMNIGVGSLNAKRVYHEDQFFGPKKEASLSGSGSKARNIDSEGDYLFAAQNNRVISVDISDPTDPVHLDSVSMTGYGESALGIRATSDGYLLVGSGSDNNTDYLVSIDARNPSSLTVADTIRHEILESSHGLALTNDEDTLLVTAAQSYHHQINAPGYLVTVDISNRGSISILDSVEILEAHDVGSLTISGSEFAITANNGNQKPVSSVDVTDPSNINIVDEIDVFGHWRGSTNGIRVLPNSNIVYSVSDDNGFISPNGDGCYLHTFEIQNNGGIKELSRVGPGDFGFYRLRIDEKNDLLYTARNPTGVFDIRNPRHPRWIGTLENAGYDLDLEVANGHLFGHTTSSIFSRKITQSASDIVAKQTASTPNKLEESIIDSYPVINHEYGDLGDSRDVDGVGLMEFGSYIQRPEGYRLFTALPNASGLYDTFECEKTGLYRINVNVAWWDPAETARFEVGIVDGDGINVQEPVLLGSFEQNVGGGRTAEFVETFEKGDRFSIEVSHTSTQIETLHNYCKIDVNRIPGLHHEDDRYTHP